jgi:hypothetical protein
MGNSKPMRECTVCGDLRPEADMKVLKKDVSERYGREPGTMSVDVWYCADREECRDSAPEVEV